MLTTSCYLVVGLGLDLVSGTLVVIHMYVSVVIVTFPKCTGEELLLAVAHTKNLKMGERGSEDNFRQVPSSFIANAHHGLYAFYTDKGSFLKKNSEPIGGAPFSPL